MKTFQKIISIGLLAVSAVSLTATPSMVEWRGTASAMMDMYLFIISQR